jgi:hypothetical protein
MTPMLEMRPELRLELRPELPLEMRLDLPLEIQLELPLEMRLELLLILDLIQRESTPNHLYRSLDMCISTIARIELHHSFVR